MNISPRIDATIELNDKERKLLFKYISIEEDLDKLGEVMCEDMRRIVFHTEKFIYVESNDVRLVYDPDNTIRPYFVLTERTKLWNRKIIRMDDFKRFLASEGYVDGKQYQVT